MGSFFVEDDTLFGGCSCRVAGWIFCWAKNWRNTAVLAGGFCAVDSDGVVQNRASLERQRGFVRAVLGRGVVTHVAALV